MEYKIKNLKKLIKHYEALYSFFEKCFIVSMFSFALFSFIVVCSVDNKLYMPFVYLCVLCGTATFIFVALLFKCMEHLSRLTRKLDTYKH